MKPISGMTAKEKSDVEYRLQQAFSARRAYQRNDARAVDEAMVAFVFGESKSET